MPRLNVCARCGQKDEDLNGLCFLCSEAMADAENETIKSQIENNRQLLEVLEALEYSTNLTVNQRKEAEAGVSIIRRNIAWLIRLENVV